MRAGKSAEQALKGLLASDPQAAIRQVAMVDKEGKLAVHTGEKCIEVAGHRRGSHYSVGKVEESLPFFKKVFTANPIWQDLVPRLVKAELLPNKEEAIAKITKQL